MQNEEFRAFAHQMVDWMADYLSQVEQYPVKSKVDPGDILKELPLHAPLEGEPFQGIFNDFINTILPGVTHWQHPNFFAYFPANASPPSILAEMLTATLGLQCMSWQTSPAATELEERVMQWLREMLGLPISFTGVIQDSASIATLCSLLTAREKATENDVNRRGLYHLSPFTLYCSSEAHSSIEKAVKIAGLGNGHLRKIPIDANLAMDVAALELQIKEDIRLGFKPLWVVAALGTTGTTAIDPLDKISVVCQQYNLWLHVDAAYAGSALLLPEMKHYLKGIEAADSFVMNPHKWMLTNFDCSTYFVKDKEALIQCFTILPEYLKTKETSAVNNYRDWSISLGRRFRALKLWFVIRSYGIQGLQTIIRNHIALTHELTDVIKSTPDFEICAPYPFNVICFRYRPIDINDEAILNLINEELLMQLNAGGKLYVTHTKIRETYVIRLVIGQTNVTKQHVLSAWELILKTAYSLNTDLFIQKVV